MLAYLCCVLFVFSLVQGQGFNFPSENSSNEFTYVGAASQVNGNTMKVLTAARNVVGAVYFHEKQYVDESFVIRFTYSFLWGRRDVPGEGMALVIQNQSPTKVAGIGPFIGFGFPCIAMKVDTNDGAGYNIAIQYGGSPTANNSPGSGATIASIVPNFPIATNGAHFTLQLQYDHNLGVFSVFRVDGSSNSFLFETNPGYFIEEMLNLDRGAAWIGFTSASGSIYAGTFIHMFEFVSKGVQIPVAIICPNDMRVTANSDTCTYKGTTGTPTVINLTGQGLTSYTKEPRGPIPTGVTNITYTAYNTKRDSTTSCQQTITVQAPPSCT